MSPTITKRVGRGSLLPMDDENVQRVIDLLRAVPVEEGGPGGELKPPVKRDRLEWAICNFQAYQFSQVSGFVDPEFITIRRLELYASGARPGPDALSMQFKAARQQIVACAQSLVGKVSNQHVDRKTRERHGWRELWEIFDVAGIPIETEDEYEHRKRSPKFKLPAGKKLPFDHFKHVRGGTPGMAWCGIFATWALNRAGYPCKWVVNKGIRHLDGSPIPVLGPSGITIGDVCVVNDQSVTLPEDDGQFGMEMFGQHLAHHIIVASHPTPHGTIDVIEGNYPHLDFGAHSIVDDACRMPQGKRNIRQIVHRYSLFEPMSM